MKFFAKQKVDQIGITAVTLQKILLFLMILSIFTMFNGGFFSFFLCLIGFIGAYKRSSGMLTAYVSISVVLIVLCSIVAISSIFVVSSDDYVYDYSSSSSSSPVASGSADKPVFAQGNMHKIQRLFARKLSAIGSESNSASASESSDSVASSSPTWSTSTSYSYDEEDDATFGLIFLLIVVMIFAFFLAYIKVYSVVLAWRLRKMILTAATSLPVTDVAPTQTHEFSPANTSCAVPETEAPVPPPVAPFQTAPLFAPGFAPYPYGMPMMHPQMQAQFQGQFPHHVMFGQQPVFYTYAPMPQSPSEEKL
eukprot:Phypoly_transcript_13020.p1 GENE.Phypoly_transcript_13020~~Phypoly_transcript_13020.p1  ORF type:complete len:325 (+),score=46.18 Phypoly_transcript_13020:53-976(+)